MLHLVACIAQVKFAQGEQQKKLDVLANEVFINMLAKSGQCAIIVSTHPQILEQNLQSAC